MCDERTGISYPIVNTDEWYSYTIVMLHEQQYGILCKDCNIARTAIMQYCNTVIL